MVPIEVVWLIIVLLFGLVGVVRGFLKELGVTLVMVVMLFAANNIEGRVVPMVTKVAARVMPGDVTVPQAVLWLGVVILTAFVSYHGQTLAYEGRPVEGPLGTVLNLGTGLINGSLIAGSIWFYLHRLNYPLLPVRVELLSRAARVLIPYLPPQFLAPYLLYIILFLVLMRVVR